MLTDPGGLQTYLDSTVKYDVHETFDIDGDTFATNTAPAVQRGTLRNALGREVATCEFTIMCGGGSAWIQTALTGSWDGKPVTVTRTFVGGASLVRFKGFVSDVRVTSTSVTIIAKSIIPELRRTNHLREFATVCPWVLGSAECGGGTSCDHSIDTCTTGNFGGFVGIPTKSD